MPRLSCWFVRSSLINLMVGFTLGSILLLAKADVIDARVWLWLPAHVDVLLAGWMIQLAMGVGYWILPRLGEAGRGRVRLAVLAFILLNIGLLLSVWTTVVRLWLPQVLLLYWLFPLGILLQVGALVCFVLHAAPRIIPMMPVKVSTTASTSGRT